jgi:hypothetical protein
VSTLGAVAYEELADRIRALIARERGRLMPGWLLVSSAEVRSKPQPANWVALSTTFARSLPAKR